MAADLHNMEARIRISRRCVQCHKTGNLLAAGPPDSTFHSVAALRKKMPKTASKRVKFGGAARKLGMDWTPFQVLIAPSHCGDEAPGTLGPAAVPSRAKELGFEADSGLPSECDVGRPAPHLRGFGTMCGLSASSSANVTRPYWNPLVWTNPSEPSRRLGSTGCAYTMGLRGA